MDLQTAVLQDLSESFGSRLQLAVPLGRYTAARLGGPADALLEVHTVDDLVSAVTICWKKEFPFQILGSGSNVLVSDFGVHGLVLINKARRIQFNDQSEPPLVWAESGCNLGLLARMAAKRGLAGLEWAAGIPGTLGGAVVGNAGAHGGDIAGNLALAEILHRTNKGQNVIAQREDWPVMKLAFEYRSSVLKRNPGETVVLAASLNLQPSSVNAVESRLEELVAYRHRTQPPGASMGSMFKNPPGDYAGRLIEAAGLKGARIGDAQISPVHANFFINLGNASATDVEHLIQHAREQVIKQFGIQLELEIELVGEW